MTSQGGASAKADWYPDPSNPGLLRYWDGTQWTSHTAPAQGHVGGPTAPKKKLSGGWIAAIVVGAVLVVGIPVILILTAVAVPVYESQQAKASDTAARADVATLGIEVNVWYVDHTGAPPTIEESGGHYFMDGVDVGPVSEGVSLGGISGTSEADWCVWVENPDGDLRYFQYSPAGMNTGRCD